MTQADFYHIASRTLHDQWLYACRLIEQKILPRKLNVLVQLDSRESAEAFDKLLWEFRPDAFVPHALLDAEDAPADCPVSIGWQDDPGHHHDVMINLSHEVPVFFSRFRRFVEILIEEDAVLTRSREHLKFLKDRGYPWNYHDMRMR